MGEEFDPPAESLDVAICRAESTLARLLEWIKAADTRLGFALPLATAMLGGLAALAPPPCSWSLFGTIMSAFAVLSLFLSVGFLALSSFPRTKGPLGSMFYFEGIASKEQVQYESAFKAMSDKDYLSDLLRQCHRNAQIAERKFTWVKRSISCIYVAVVPWAFGILSFTLGASSGGF